jgi:hypothetical protein
MFFSYSDDLGFKFSVRANWEFFESKTTILIDFDTNGRKMRTLAILSVLMSVTAVLCEEDFSSTPVVLWHGMGNEKFCGISRT